MARPSAAIVLAAGLGKRMKSDLPKVLHPVCGRPMIEHVLSAIEAAGVDKIFVVTGHKGEMVRAIVGDRGHCIDQPEQLGTGHAVMMAEPVLKDFDGDVLITCGDTPLISTETFKSMLHCRLQSQCAGVLLTAIVDNPYGYGRIVRGTDSNVAAIVEHKDCSEDQHSIREINVGSYCFDNRLLWQALAGISNENSQGEYYLTDVPEILIELGQELQAVVMDDNSEMLGVNSRKQLAEAGLLMRNRLLDRLMARGVTIVDPGSTYLEAAVNVGAESTLMPGTVLRGKTRIGDRCVIGPNTEIIDALIGDDCIIRHSVVEGAKVKSGETVGPFEHREYL